MNYEILDSKTFELTPEQEVQVRVFEQQIQAMSRTELENLLVQTKLKIILKDNIICDLLQGFPA